MFGKKGLKKIVLELKSFESLYNKKTAFNKIFSKIHGIFSLKTPDHKNITGGFLFVCPRDRQ